MITVQLQNLNVDRSSFICCFLAIPYILYLKKLNSTKHSHTKVFVPEVLELSGSYVY